MQKFDRQLSLNWTIQFLGRIIAQVPRSSLSLFLAGTRFYWIPRAALSSFFQVAARSREVASSSIIRPSHLTNVSVRFHIARNRGFLVLSREWKRRCPGVQFLDRNGSLPDLVFWSTRSVSSILILRFVSVIVINLIQFMQNKCIKKK